MTARLLIDTDVLIDHLRGQTDAVAFIRSLTSQPLVSSVTVAELFAGVRDGAERTALELFLSGLEIVPVDDAIARADGLYRRDFGKSHGVGLPDALIAATADLHGAALVTLNAKHFPMLAGVTVPFEKS